MPKERDNDDFEPTDPDARDALRKWIGQVAHRTQRIWWIINGIEPPGPALIVRFALADKAEKDNAKEHDEMTKAIAKLEDRVDEHDKTITFLAGGKAALLLALAAGGGIVSAVVSVIKALKS